MPQSQTLETRFALNGTNSPSPSGTEDVRTHEPIWGAGLVPGVYFDLTEKEANQLSFTEVGILHAGRYRWVQVDKNATPANIVRGKIGVMPTALTPELNIVTSADHGHVGVRMVVFLNPPVIPVPGGFPVMEGITPGNYVFVQELGIASVLFSGTATIGAAVAMQSDGRVAAGATLPSFVGVALEAGAANQISRVELGLPVQQG